MSFALQLAAKDERRADGLEVARGDVGGLHVDGFVRGALRAGHADTGAGRAHEEGSGKTVAHRVDAGQRLQLFDELPRGCADFGAHAAWEIQRERDYVLVAEAQVHAAQGVQVVAE